MCNIKYNYVTNTKKTIRTTTIELFNITIFEFDNTTNSQECTYISYYIQLCQIKITWIFIQFIKTYNQLQIGEPHWSKFNKVIWVHCKKLGHANEKCLWNPDNFQNKLNDKKVILTIKDNHSNYTQIGMLWCWKLCLPNLMMMVKSLH